MCVYVRKAFTVSFVTLDNVEKENNTIYISYSERNKGTHIIGNKENEIRTSNLLLIR